MIHGLLVSNKFWLVCSQKKSFQSLFLTSWIDKTSMFLQICNCFSSILKKSITDHHPDSWKQWFGWRTWHCLIYIPWAPIWCQAIQNEWNFSMFVKSLQFTLIQILSSVALFASGDFYDRKHLEGTDKSLHIFCWISARIHYTLWHYRETNVYFFFPLLLRMNFRNGTL